MSLNRVKNLIQVSIFSAIAVILTFFNVPVFFVPSFYKLDLSYVINLIGSFFLGPINGILILLFKILVKMLIKPSTTYGLGEFADFIMGIALILPCSLIYKKNRTFNGALIGMLCGVILFLLISSVFNYFFLIPMYERLFNISEKSLILLCNKINPFISNKFTLIIFAVLPFNIIKSLCSCILTLILYKKFLRTLKKYLY